MILTKVFLYNGRKNIDKLDFMISSLGKEDKLLELELNLLTNPKRLEELYSELHDKYFTESIELNYNQIKDLNSLYPYFYSRRGASLEKTLASK
jgi:hypothetical protein